MSFSDTMSGYKKIKNEDGYTNETLLKKMKQISYSFGTPGIGKVGKKEAIVFDKIGEFTVYISVTPKSIEIGRVVTEGSTSFVAKNLLAAVVSDAQALNTAEADRAVEELYEVLESLLETGVLQNNASAKVERVLYVRQKILSIKDKYSVCTEDETPVYWVEGTLTGLSFKIEDSYGNQILQIKKKLISIMPEYTILKEEKVLGKMRKKIKLTKPEVGGQLMGDELKLEGDLSGYHFAFKLNGVTVGSVDTVRLTWGDTYAIKIRDTDREEVVVAIAIIIDNMLKGKNN